MSEKFSRGVVSVDAMCCYTCGISAVNGVSHLTPTHDGGAALSTRHDVLIWWWSQLARDGACFNVQHGSGWSVRGGTLDERSTNNKMARLEEVQHAIQASFIESSSTLARRSNSGERVDASQAHPRDGPHSHP